MGQRTDLQSRELPLNVGVLDDLIEQYKLEYNISDDDIIKFTQNRWNSILMYINNKYITPTKVLYINKTEYNVNNLEVLLNYLIYKSYIYDKIVNFMSYSLISGIDYNVIMQWNIDKKLNNKYYAIFQKLRNNNIETLSSNVSNNKSVIGNLALLNHYYGFQEVHNFDTMQGQHVLTTADLPQLPQIDADLE